jgi:hypothetical protein
VREDVGEDGTDEDVAPPAGTVVTAPVPMGVAEPSVMV